MMGQMTRHGLASYRHEDDITVVLIVIVIMFIATQTPALVTQVHALSPSRMLDRKDVKTTPF